MPLYGVNIYMITLLLEWRLIQITLCMTNIFQAVCPLNILVVGDRIYPARIFSRKCGSKYSRKKVRKRRKGDRGWERQGILLCIHNFPEIKTASRQSRLKLSRFFYVLLFNHTWAEMLAGILLRYRNNGTEW